MRTGISIALDAADREALEALAADRNTLKSMFGAPGSSF
jgi:hypothetical protein